MYRTARPLRAAFVVAISLLAAVPARAALLGYWSFDGCTATDASGNAADLGLFNAPTCVGGRFGQAWQLNGIDQYLDRGFDSRFTPGLRPWTVAAWVKSDSSNTYQTLVQWYRCGANPACTDADPALYELALDQGRPFWFARDDLSNAHPLGDTVSVADGNWHLLVGTMNAATDSVKLYVDGALRKVSAGPLGNVTNGAIPIPLEVGRHFRTGWGFPIGYLTGAIDEVRIYDVELDAEQVAQLFSGNTTAVGGPVAGTGLALRGVNPARGGRLAVAFTLAAAGEAEVAAFDLAGRRVARVSGMRGAGEHEVDLAADRSLRPGIYLIRVTQGTQSATRTVSLLD